ncbi:MAG: thiolase family protein [Candidatus Riflebacteria bacterium]|nr:thiolase family protein [Candidatus Riflebacteria bacterium]
MKKIVIVDGVRTPQGTLGGALKDLSAQRLGEIVVTELLKRTGVSPGDVDELIAGCVGQSSDAPNIARVIALRAGIPKEKPSYTVARNCASGTQAIVSAYQAMQCGDGEVYVAVGTESMSTAPFINRDIRFGKKLQHSQLIDTLWEGLTDPFCGQIMGRTAENLAEEFGITREQQDSYAVSSHKRAFKATREGKFKDEIAPVTVEKKVMGKTVATEPFTADEGPNIALNVQTLALYPTIFKENGSVTPGNSCPISDGAAAVLLMTEDRAKAMGLTPLASLRSYAFAGVEPERMGIGPAHATPIALKRAGVALSDLQLIEINEAFAVQYLSVEKALGLNRELVNVNGGAIALGHPVGATGVRIVVTLLKEMKKRNLSLGLASLCVGGGLGAALVLERN